MLHEIRRAWGNRASDRFAGEEKGNRRLDDAPCHDRLHARPEIERANITASEQRTTPLIAAAIEANWNFQVYEKAYMPAADNVPTT